MSGERPELGEPEYEVTLEMAREAAAAVAPYLHPTPCQRSEALSERLGRPVFLKCENRMVTGSFKVRGALARISRLQGEESHRGVVACSAGNHALGVAWACRSLGVPGLVVVPETISPMKLQALHESTIKIRQVGRCYDETEVEARRIAGEAEATFISPFDDPWVMAGNGGTIGLELQAQLPDLCAVVTPVGGGGLAAGLGTVLKPGVSILGVNAAASPGMARSLAEGRVYLTLEPSEPTLAEGLEGGVSPTSAALCARLLSGVEVVSEAAIRQAIRFMVREESMVLEGSAAAAVAALLEERPIPGGDGPVAVILTGRNIAPQVLRGVLEEKPAE